MSNIGELRFLSEMVKDARAEYDTHPERRYQLLPEIESLLREMRLVSREIVMEGDDE
jgi:hypothetical protein